MASQRISGILSRNQAAGDARAFLGVFGKHPGWNDHIDDIGLSTERLVQIKRVLYVEGIGGNIDAGAWDAMPEAGRLPGFEHLFLWRWAGETAMGRFWSSRDGKGRTRYPMVVAAQVRGQPVSWQVRYVAPTLERLEEEFKAADSAERVIALAENATREMDALAGGETAAPDRHEQSATAMIAAHEAMGPDKRGMYRLLYQMERELSAFLRGGVTDGSRTRVADLTPRHLRVPRCLSDEGQSVLLWWRFVTEHIGDSAPVVLLSPRGAGFIDILVGESGVSQFTCVRAGEATIPLTTEIPYTFDEDFIRRAEARIAGAPVDVKSDATRKVAQAGAALGGAIEKVKAAGGARGLEPKTVAMLAGVGVLGLVLIGGLLLLMASGGGSAKNGNSGGGTTDTPGGSGAGDSGAGAPGAAGASFGPQERADFAEWCAQAEWALQLSDRLGTRDLSVLRADPHLNTALVPLLERLRSPDLVLDPRRVATGGPRQLSALGASPPPSAQTADAIAKTRAALEVLRGIKSALTAPNWPALAAVARAEKLSVLAGWPNLSEALATVASGVNIQAPNGLATVEAVARTAGPAARLEAAWTRYEAAHRDLIDAQGSRRDERLTALPGLLARVELPAPTTPESAADSVAAAAGRLESMATLTADVARTARERWAVVDVPYFLASSGLEPPAGGADEAYYRAWIQEVRRDAYSLLDPQADPRTSWDVEPRLAALATEIQGLKQGAGGIDPAEIAALERDVAELRVKLGLATAMVWDRGGQAGVVAAATELDRSVGAIEDGYDRLTGRLTEQWERETTRLRERRTVSGVVSPALLEAWGQRRDALLAAFTTPDRLAALNERVAELEEFLVAVEQAVPTPPMPRQRPSVLDADALERAIAAQRERAVAAVLARAPWDGQRYPAESLSQGAAAAASELTLWGQRVAKAAEDMASVEALLAGGYGVDEPGPGGATIAALRPSASESEVGAEVAAVFEPLAAQARAIASVEAEADTAALARAAGDTASPIGVSLAAWRSLAERGWPATPAELRTESQLARGLAARVSGLGDQERRAKVAQEIDDAQAARWSACAGRVQSGTDAAALREVLAMRESFGATIDTLPATLRLSALCDEFGRGAQAASSASDDAALKRAASEFISKVEGLALDGAALAPVAPWLEEVRGLASETQTAPVIDVTTLGPGSVGWRGEEVDDQRVRFTSPDGALALEFVLIEPGDDPALGEAAYLCTTEVSIGLLQSAAAQGDNLTRLKSLIETAPPSDGAGYKTWVLGTRQGRETVVPAENWFLAGEVAQGIQPWAQGLTPGRPGPKTPVTQIAPGTAAAVAGWLGCRLPTGVEWQAARTRYETGNGTTPAWNLRDNTWGAQLRHVRAVQSGGRLGIRFPDEGVFHPTGSAARTEGQAQTLGTDDGSLLLDEVDRVRGHVVLHLVGNVSEYVAMGDATAATPQFGVVGASAFSAPEDYQALQSACPIPPQFGDYGWSDVGFRMAFSAKGDGGAVPLWRRMQRLGASAPVLVGVAP